jgi:phosphatidylserine decarboxylase
MKDRQGIFDTILSVLTPIHWDGHKFIALGAILTLLLFWIWDPLGWIGVLATAYVAYFFRDPERATPVREDLVIAPADGRIVSVRLKTPPAELGLPPAPMTCISIFLSVFDVHINRAPVTGTLARRSYVPGLFLNAALDKASDDNEREAMVFRMASGREIGMVRIAGLVARRIVTLAQEGQRIEAGARVGLIRFGSRVDVYIPEGRGVLVAEGQRAIGGETVLADLRSEELGREVRVG